MPPGGTGQPMAVTSKATRKALKLRLGILSEREVERMSVVEINSEHLLDRTMQPQRGGPCDPKLGTTDRDVLCGTCGCSYIDCPGHFGHIKLAKPVYHAGYLTNVHKVLQCICIECGLVKLRNKELRDAIKKKPSARTRFRRVHEVCKNIKECQPGDDNVGCGHFQPKYRKEGLSIIREYYQDSSEAQGQGDPRRPLRAKEAKHILSKINDEDMRLMGMDPEQSRPEWMIISSLAVVPPPVRPSVMAGDGARGVDDLTYAYCMIVRFNEQLKNAVNDGRPEAYQDQILKGVQLSTATLMDNNIQDQPCQKRSCGKPIKDIRSRLKGKEGRVRGNLMGKRVDFSARTVITPDPILQLDELGVPEAIAMNLTIPEHVTLENMHVMKQLVANGPTKWPGAKYIIRHDERQIDLACMRNRADAHLDPGYIVERQLRDGDYVVFNRQPSLHKMSLMGHRVKVLPFQTFRLNLSVTSPYNADFDGDEMNMHVPQSYETKAEIKEIMAVPKQIVAPSHNRPVMGIVQDALIGIWLITQRDTFIEMDLAMNLLMWLDHTGTLPPPAILKPRPLWTGKQILSLVIPKANMKKGDNWITIDDSSVLVKDGQLLCGVMSKDTVGAKSGGLVHIIWRDQGAEACRDFLSDAQNIINNWLIHHGFTVGVHDIMASSDTTATIAKALGKYKRNVQRIVQQTQRHLLEPLPGKGMHESFEAEVNRTLRAALEKSGKIALEDLEVSNKLRSMVTAGSKGSKLNISQIMACVGQQNVEGKRIPFGFNRRSLPHFSKDDFGPESKGFVTSCYVHGLTPQEFYFHAMGGREGLIDTAVKTAETGYIQRRLIKALEDVQVKYDGTVRTSRDQVLQFIYGEDGMAAEYIEDLKIPLLMMNNDKMEKQFQFFSPEANTSDKKLELQEYVRKDVVEDIEDFEQLCEDLESEYKQLKVDRETLRTQIIKVGDDQTHLPVNIPRLVWNVKEEFKVKPRALTDLSPDYVIKKKQELLDTGIRVYQEPRLRASELFVEANQNATQLFKIYLRSQLCTKQVIQKDRLDKNSFDNLIGEISTRFERSLAHPGEMAGSIGAQSMGEPATQMTLNTFHSAGVASANVTLGVPRLKEVINVAKTIKTPSIRIFLESEHSKDQKAAKAIGEAIQHTTLSHVVASTAIYYDPDPEKTIIKADEALLQDYLDIQQMQENPDDNREQSPWLLRFELDRDKLAGRNLSMNKIQDIFTRELDDEQVKILRHLDTDMNLPKLIFRLRLPDIEADEDNDEETVPMMLKQSEEKLVNELTLQGFPEIQKVAYSKEAKYSKETVWNPVTGDHETSSKNWIIETDGVALKKIMAVDYVDFKRTTSNDMIEILTVLGVEAARLCLIIELRFVLGTYDIYVNYRHLATLCDIMTTRGILTAITRHGINRVDSGALRKCSFEETVEILLEAAFHAEVDPLSGVTENIIMGQLAPYGTGCFDLMINTEALKDAPCSQKQFFNDDAKDQIIDYSSGPGTPMVGTPIYESPQHLGAASIYGGNTPMNTIFTPMYPTQTDGGMNPMGSTPYGAPGAAASSRLYKPTGTTQYPGPAVNSPIYAPDFMGGTTPAPTQPAGQGGGGGYSPTTTQFPFSASPLYNRPGAPQGTPHYSKPGGGAPFSGGPQTTDFGRTPLYKPGGTIGSPVYQHPTGGFNAMSHQSPVYAPPNAAYSPTQTQYGIPDPAYLPGSAPGQTRQPPPEKK